MGRWLVSYWKASTTPCISFYFALCCDISNVVVDIVDTVLVLVCECQLGIRTMRIWRHFNVMFNEYQGRLNSSH